MQQLSLFSISGELVTSLEYNFMQGFSGNVRYPGANNDPEGLSGFATGNRTMAEVFRPCRISNAAHSSNGHLGQYARKASNGQGFDYFFGHQDVVALIFYVPFLWGIGMVQTSRICGYLK